jgi:hypothetical protein
MSKVNSSFQSFSRSYFMTHSQSVCLGIESKLFMCSLLLMQQINVVVFCYKIFFSISKFTLQSVVIHLAELCVRLQWFGERHSVEPLRK